MSNSTVVPGSACEDHTHLIFSSIYKGVVTGELIAACLALTPNILLTLVIWRVSVFPVNLRLLLGQFSFLLTWLSIGNIIKSVYVLSAPACAYHISQQGCKIFELVVSTLPLATVNYSLIALCVERLVATVIYKRYEKGGWHNKPYLACALIVMAQVIAVAVNAHGVAGLPTNVYVAVCESNFLPSTSLPYLVQIYLSNECLAALFTIFIYFYNKRVAKSMAINRALYDLSSRFLIDQNVQINAIVVPSMTLHFLAHIPAYTIGNIQKSIVLDLSTKAWLARTTVLLRLIYAVMHPVIAFYFNAHMRQQLLVGTPLGWLLQRLGVRGIKKSKLGRATRRVEHLHTNNLAVHFDHLDRVWALVKPSNKITPGSSRAAWGERKSAEKPQSIAEQPKNFRF